MMSYIASVLLVVTPDSMRVERLVSHIQLCEDNSSVWVEWGNHQRPTCSRLQIQWYCELGSPTSSAVAKFLTVKDRRQTAPDIKTYKTQCTCLCGNFSSKWIGLHTVDWSTKTLHTLEKFLAVWLTSCSSINSLSTVYTINKQSKHL